MSAPAYSSIRDNMRLCKVRKRRIRGLNVSEHLGEGPGHELKAPRKPEPAFLRAEESTVERAIQRGNLTHAQILEHTGMSEERLRATMFRLRYQGRIECDGPSCQAEWRLVEEGKLR
jgi:hypothetical protein